MKKVILTTILSIPLSLIANSALAGDTVLDRFYTPAEAGIIWVSVKPMFLD